MNEDDVQPTVDGGTTRRPGHELRAARERAGIERDELATTLHLPEQQVKALEADDYTQLPPAAFVRGYLRAYAREVGLDADEIVAEFDAASGEIHDPDIVLHTGEPDPAGGHGAVVALVIVILVAVIGMGAWWLQQGGGVPIDTGDVVTGEAAEEPAATEPADTAGDGNMAPEDGAAAEPTAPEPPPGESAAQATDATAGSTAESAGDSASEAETGTTATAASEQQAATEESPATEATGAGATAGETSEETADETTADAAADTAEAAEDAAPEPEAMVAEGDERPRATSRANEVATAAAATGPNVLVIQVDGRSWLEVFDARGRQLAYTLYSGDEPVRLLGWAPFDVFLGNAPAVNLRFGETTVDHSAFVRSDNTARFVVDAEGASRR